jgi:hypothetical protein
VIAKSNRAKVECASLVILATSSKWKSRQVETVPGAMIPRFQSSSAAVRSARPRWKGWIPMSERVIGFFCSGQRQSFTTGGIPQAESLVVLVDDSEVGVGAGRDCSGCKNPGVPKLVDGREAEVDDLDFDVEGSFGLLCSGQRQDFTTGGIPPKPRLWWCLWWCSYQR